MLSVLKDHLFSVMSEINEVVWCIDANSFNLLYANEACYKIWGYSPTEMMADNSIFYQSIHPEDIEIYKRGISSVIENGRAYSEFRVIRKDGSIRFIQGDSFFRKGLNKLPDNITGITTDVTDIRNKNELLLSKNKELESIISENGLLKNDKDSVTDLLLSYQNAINANVICSITDKKGIITFINDNFCKIAQYTREEMIGKTHNIINSGYHPKKFFAEMWKALTKGKMWTGEVRNKAKDGSYYWVDSVIMPIKDKNNSVNGYLSLRILIDDRKKMEEEKAAYLKTVENMLFMVSHEIRKPIASCQGVLDLLKNGKPLSDDEYNLYISYLTSSAFELDDYSHKLNSYLQNSFK